MSFWLYVFSGVVVGCLVGLTGVGGGSLMTPLLILLFGVYPATAVGSDLLYAAVTKVVGTAVHGQHGSVDWRITRRLAAGSVPAVLLTLAALTQWPSSGHQSHVLSVTLGVVLLLTAIVLLARKALLGLLAAPIERLSPAQIKAATVATGAVLGCLVTLTSVGAGALGMTMLLLLYPRSPVVRLVGSDIAHAVPLTLLAGFGHWFLGDVNFGLVGSLLLGSVPGVVVGSLLSFRLPELLLRLLLAAVLLVAASQLLT
jgi:uncharacterized membrane protein YfcA